MGLSGLRLEAESYTSPDVSCDPDWDNEHTRLAFWEYAGAPVTMVFLPHSGCGLTFRNVPFDADLMPVLGAAYMEAPRGTTATIETRLLSDGVLVAKAVSEHVGGQSLQTPLVFTGGDVPTGVHTLRLEYRVLAGPSWVNLDLDYVEFLPSCPNLPPVLGGVVGDGMAGGLVGWAGASYDLEAVQVRDPEGDPVTVAWTLPDGRRVEGASLTTSFATKGVKQLTLTLVDDPTLRCAGGVARTVSIPVTFDVRPDWAVTLDGRFGGSACLDTRIVPILRAPVNVLAGECHVRASVATGPAPPAFGVLSTLTLDGETLTSSRTLAPGTVYDTLAHPTQTRVLQACAGATDDKHGRVFCSAPHEFLSVGA